MLVRLVNFRLRKVMAHEHEHRRQVKTGSCIYMYIAGLHLPLSVDEEYPNV